ncbi:penicillin amidase [Erythrobacter longus]|uniref:Penicillin amidase n=1 Tax=Erythrobacter longus TaxID=1044 RepID=A0A074MXJ3_ERYLO|nr:acylase [Erythrobacter longus]KEO90337.1 penicillin amidase [Erythrobacter longus]
MKWVKRGVLGLIGIALVTFVFLATWEPFMAHQSKAPDYREYSAEIVRSEYGVPMIYGETDADVAFGVAVAHAEDDFFTLQDVAAMAKGRYGAIAGPDGAQIDFVYHLIDARGTAKREFPKLPADTQALFNAYAAGLNHYAEQNPAEVKLANLFPVNGEDIAAGFTLRQPFFYGLANVIGPLVEGGELRKEFGPDIPGFPRPNSPAQQLRKELGEEIAHGFGIGDEHPNLVLPMGRAGDHMGSNAWAVKPEKTGGPTTLISNSHQPLRGGVAWYELGVQSGEGWHFTGANFPGSPFPFLGHNENLGWTNTVNRPDMTDVYELEMNEAGDSYRLDGKWYELDAKEVLLPVKMGPVTLPVTQTVYRSAHHGPVIKNDKGAFAIRYGGMDKADQLDAYYRLNKAKTFEEWEAQIARMAIPSTNFIYADIKGNIAYVYNAAIPNRPENVEANWRGVLDGSRSDLIWNGSVEYERIPKLINPASGWLYNSNNEPYTAAGEGSDLSPDDFSPVLGIELKQTNRSYRAYRMMSEAAVLDRKTLERIKYDTAYERLDYVDLLYDALEAMEVPSRMKQAGGPGGTLDDARNLMLKWDYSADGEGPADAIALLMILSYMGAEYNNTPVPDVTQKLEEARSHLIEHFGRLDPPMSELLRLRQGNVDLPLDGGSDTLRASTIWRMDDDGRLSLVHGDSFIQWVEWPADGGENGGRVTSRSIQPFGAATTRPDSKHFTDQMQLYVDHRLKPVHFFEEDVRANAGSTKVVTNAK